MKTQWQTSGFRLLSHRVLQMLYNIFIMTYLEGIFCDLETNTGLGCIHLP